MNKSRRCDARCHSAKRHTCRCWCGGVFHGNGPLAQLAREAFAREYGGPIPAESPALTEPLLHLPSVGSRFTAAFEAARHAIDALELELERGAAE